MELHLSNYSWGSPRQRGEGLRISTTRYLPRGIRKEDYARGDFLDVWLPSLAPSRALLKWSKGSKLDDKKWWATFVRRYRSEMAKTDARQTIQMLAMLARQTPISVGCRCSGSRCHRFELVKLIRSAHAGKL